MCIMNKAKKNLDTKDVDYINDMVKRLPDYLVRMYLEDPVFHTILRINMDEKLDYNSLIEKTLEGMVRFHSDYEKEVLKSTVMRKILYEGCE